MNLSKLYHHNLYNLDSDNWAQMDNEHKKAAARVNNVPQAAVLCYTMLVFQQGWNMSSPGGEIVRQDVRQ